MPFTGRRIRSFLRPLIPQRFRAAALNRLSQNERYRTGSLADIFGAIYRDGIWGSRDDFYSGGGSHEAADVDPYVEAIRAFAATLDAPVAAVDLGCGDFAVGAKLVPFFASYCGCDVVPALIERNRIKFSDPNLRFEVADLVAGPLPKGDVAMVRQVLQHLSNDQVAEALRNLSVYPYVIITEHVPAGEFRPNADKAAGPDVRLGAGSGLVLDAAPFNWPREGRTILRLDSHGSILETKVWTAKDGADRAKG